MALKLRGIEFAQKEGIRELRTWNASDNAGILEVNSRLGFVRRPAHIAYVKGGAGGGWGDDAGRLRVGAN